MKENIEEEKAIKYYQNKDISFSVDFDTKKLLEALGITEEDSFENHQIRFKTLLNLIEKLQKENEELKRLLNGNLYEDYKYYKNLAGEYQGNCISKQKIKDKIEELKNNKPYLIKFDDWRDKEYTNEDIINNCIDVLQELLEKED